MSKTSLLRALRGEELRDKYPQIIEHCKISSKISLGIEELQKAIAESATKLLMAIRTPHIKV
ncbi:hypothetical protein [Nostoc sp.]|uniref:hypothetical protein n=1 Tax=Nostoc sp. TaxID=1180 RepID=UPI002FF8DEBB